MYEIKVVIRVSYFPICSLCGVHVHLTSPKTDFFSLSLSICTLMSPGPFALRIQHGIVGGFVPPRPTAVHDLSLETDTSHIFLRSEFPFPSDPGVQALEQGPKSLSIPISEDTTSLVKELGGILRNLPKEEEPSVDIYGRNIGLFWQGPDGFTWVNTAPEGCGASESTVVVTEDDKKAFDRAVAITEILVKRGVADEDN